MVGVERLTIRVSAEGDASVVGQTVTVKNPGNGYVYYEGVAREMIRVNIPLGSVYEISITEMDGYAPIMPVLFSATEKERTVYLQYEALPPVVGDFVYADGSWSATYKADRTCVGICFYVNGEDRRMVALTRPETGSGSSPAGAWGDSACCWGDTVAGGTDIMDHTMAITDMNGRGNTDLILAVKQTDHPAYDSPADYPAANFCNNYSYGNKGKGSWWLPACGELYHIQQQREMINRNVVLAGGVSFEGMPGMNEFFWSSTIASLGRSTRWSMDFAYGQISMRNIRDLCTVLPVTSF